MQIYIHTTLHEPLRRQLLDGISDAHTVEFREENDSDALARKKFDRGQLVLGNPPKEWLEQKTTDLEFWQLDSAGFDAYKSVRIKGRAANMGDWFARPCAETIVAGLMALYRGIDALTLLKQNKQWVGHTMRPYLGLMDRREVIILGAGTIGTATRQILEGFRCRVRMVARSSPQAALRSKDEFLDALPSADILVNTLPGTANKYVDREVFATMKSGSVYANVGRGNTTDEEALLDALRNDHLSGAVLDVTEIEPLPADSSLWTLPNVILTQHTGGGQADEGVGKVELFLRNLKNLETGEPIESEVDLSRGY